MAAARGLTRRGPLVAAALAALALAACANQPPHWSAPAEYTVQGGDTLYSIAFRHRLDWRDLARWNDIDPPGYLIRAGDRLRLRAPGPGGHAPLTARTPRAAAPAPAEPAAPPRVERDNRVTFRWPARGEVVASNGKGIGIVGAEGAEVVAAAAGRVVYTGSGLIGYGRLIIVKHNNQLLSAYAHNQEILVREGDELDAGQVIATMGIGPARRAMLHFEVRVDGRTVDPLEYLPPQ